MAGSSGLRERKKVATRCALTTAALRLAAELGLDKVTVEDIADAAGVSVRTFFNYFPTKEAAFVADDLERGRRFVAAVVAAPPDAPAWDLLRQAAVRSMCTVELPSREHALKQQLVRTSPALIAEVLGGFALLEHQLVVELDRRTASRGGLHSRLMANAAIAAVRAATDTWLAAEQPADSYAALLDQSFTALAPAFAVTGDRWPGGISCATTVLRP